MPHRPGSRSGAAGPKRARQWRQPGDRPACLLIAAADKLFAFGAACRSRPVTGRRGRIYARRPARTGALYVLRTLAFAQTANGTELHDASRRRCASVQRLAEAYRRITDELGKVIVGQQQVIEELLIAMFARGHCLLVGVPGLAKTLMIRTLADALSLKFSRIQFTPDLMPADITGTEVIQEDKPTGTREFQVSHGPIFANVILADEINRTPPKTQAALLEAMQEHQVTVGGKRHRAGRAVLRAGHAEPDRAGRHLSAARGPARPLHVQHLRRLSERGRRVADRQAARRPTCRRTITPTLIGRGDRGAAADRPHGAGGRPRDPLRACSSRG